MNIPIAITNEMLTFLHAFATIAGVLLTAWYGGRAPYFPIEVSRSAATNSLALSIFRYGSLTLIIPMYYEGRTCLSDLSSWLSICGIAICDDIYYPSLHTTFLGTLITSCLLSIRTTTQAVLIIASIFVMLFRLVLVCSALLYYEFGITNVLTYPWQVIKHSRRILQLSTQIMHMVGTKPVLNNPRVVMLAFKVKGILQWTSFLLMAVAVLGS